jgi:hypothetical protein
MGGGYGCVMAATSSWGKEGEGEGGGQRENKRGGAAAKPKDGRGGSARVLGGKEWAPLRRIEINDPNPLSRLCSRPQCISQTRFYCFTDVCLLKLQTPIAQDPEEKKEKGINFNFSFFRKMGITLYTRKKEFDLEFRRFYRNDKRKISEDKETHP